LFLAPFPCEVASEHPQPIIDSSEDEFEDESFEQDEVLFLHDVTTNPSHISILDSY